MGTFDIESISELPSLKSLDYKKNAKYATLPVIILAYLERRGVDMLLVTDLTSNKESNYNLMDPEKYPPHTYEIGIKPLERSEVFYIGVASRYQPHIRKCLIDFPEFRQNQRDILDKNSCDVSMLNLLAVVNFKPQAYEGGMEGFLGNICFWGKERITGSRKQKASQYASLMNRLKERITFDLYHKLNQRFPLGEFMTSPEQTRPLSPPTDVPVLTPMVTQIPSEGNKRQCLQPASAVFRQNFSQAPTREFPVNQPVSLVTTALTNVAEEAVNSSIDEESWASFGSNPGIIHRLGLERLCREECHVLPDGTCFETYARIVRIDPKPELIFIKPFKRTMKISPFRVTLESEGHRLLLEISSEEDMCRFFGIDEVEAVIGTIPKLVSEMNSLSKKRTAVVIEKKVKQLAGGHELPYWGLFSSLESLCSSQPEA